MTLAQAWRALRRRWWIPIVIGAVAVGAVFAITPATTAAQLQYRARTILLMNQGTNQSSTVNLPEAALQVTVGSVPALAASDLHYTGSPAALASQLKVTNDTTVGTLTIEVDGVDGAAAARVANAFASALNKSLTQTALNAYQSQVALVESRLNVLKAQIAQYQGLTDPVSQAELGSAEDQYRLSYDQFQQLAAQGQPTAPFTVLQTAVPVVSGGVHPPRSRLQRSVIAGLVGLIIGLAIALLLDLLWPRINDRVDAEREFGTVVLAEVPKLSRRERRGRGAHRANDRRLASFREAYRMLRTAILLLGASESDEAATGLTDDDQLLVSGPQVILVTSPLPREGKSTTVSNLPVSMAESGRRVLVCNADFRAPQVQRAFGLESGPGLTDLLAGEDGSKHLADLVHQTSVPGVALVHSGSSVDDAAELIARRGARLLAEARGMADVVLLDTAPLLVVSDASELLPSVDAVIMVARAGQTSRDSARRSFELLDRAGIPVLGVVLVGAKSPMSYYYGGRYGYRGEGRRRWSWLPWLRRSRDVVRVDGKGRRVSLQTKQAGGAGSRPPVQPDPPDAAPKAPIGPSGGPPVSTPPPEPHAAATSTAHVSSAFAPNGPPARAAKAGDPAGQRGSRQGRRQDYR
jgi:capsular exopolysaccharide synthesis family protein